MISALCRYDRQKCVFKLRGRPNPIHPLKVELGVCHVRIRPTWFYLLPRQGANHIQGTLELVEHNILKVRVIPDDSGDVCEGGLHFALLVQFQRILPIVIFGRKLRLSKLLPLPAEGALYLIVLCGKLLHGLKAGEFRCVGVLIGLCVQCAEFMKAHHIEGVEQFPAGGVGGVMAIGKLVLVDHDARLGIGRDVVKASCHGTVLVHIGQELLDCLLHRVGPAKGAYQPGLGERVSLPLHLSGDHLLLPLGDGPLCSVMPVGVSRQHTVRVEEITVDLTEEKHTVAGCGWPVHESARLIGGIIEQLDSNVFSHLTRYRHILIRCDLTGQRDDETQARLFRCTFMGGIDEAVEGEQHLQLLHDVRGCVVHIESETRAGDDAVLFPSTITQATEYEAADILDGVLFGLRHFSILFDSFRRGVSYRNALPEGVKLHFLTVPDLLHAGVAGRYIQFQVTSPPNTPYSSAICEGACGSAEYPSGLPFLSYEAWESTVGAGYGSQCLPHMLVPVPAGIPSTPGVPPVGTTG